MTRWFCGLRDLVVQPMAGAAIFELYRRQAAALRAGTDEMGADIGLKPRALVGATLTGARFVPAPAFAADPEPYPMTAARRNWIISSGV